MLKIIAIILIVLGVLAVIYGGFTYTKATHEANLGPIEFQVKERERVNVPLWAGIVVLAAGVVMLLVPSKKA
jgi:drug/metabolite transporter (DMT)-like permease